MQTAYIETTVVSYYTARRSQDAVIAGHQEATIRFWELLGKAIEAYISDLVLQEAEKGDPEQAIRRLNAMAPFAVLDVEAKAQDLARILISYKAIPEGCAGDALHIAIAAVNGLELLVTWNFSHINNPITRILIRQCVENAGFACPEICSPDELLGGES